jgi:Zn finger protein HypA/HybF involved in hydrogenase expression
MTMQAQTGLVVKGKFEVRSGRCPDCNTVFDDRAKAPIGDKRYCPKCHTHKLGQLKQTGEMRPR